MKNKKGLTVLADIHDSGHYIFDSTVLVCKKSKQVFKIYDLLDTGKISEYHRFQNSFAGKKYILKLHDDVKIHPLWKFNEAISIKELSISVLDLGDTISIGSDLLMQQKITITQVPLIRGRSLDQYEVKGIVPGISNKRFQMNRLMQLIEESLVGQDYSGFLNPLNIKVVGIDKEKGVLKLLISDLGNSIGNLMRTVQLRIVKNNKNAAQ